MPYLTGNVHEGFWDPLETIWHGIVAAINDLSAKHPNTPIYVTGHSKGGPPASIGAALLLKAEKTAAGEVVTSASPHPGNGSFVKNYPSTIPVTRFENYLDIVPFLPPTTELHTFMHNAIPESWRKEFCSWLPSLCTAIEHASEWDYAALGPLSYVTKNGTVAGQDGPDASAEVRLASIVLALFGFDAETTLRDAVKTSQAPSLATSGLNRIGAAHCIA